VTAALASIALSKAGLLEYGSALELQRSIHSDVADSLRNNTLILLEHPPVFTAGRRTRPLLMSIAAERSHFMARAN
jgi:lipoate-protein ligase B